MNIYQDTYHKKSYDVWPKPPRNLDTIDLADLPRYLAKIGQIFDIEQLITQDLTSDHGVDYYEQSAFGYRLFHSKDSLHMALNFEGQFDADGHYGQARIIQEQLRTVQPRHVLELASGKGFNSRYLAEHNRSDIQFVGVDLTPSHVETARERAKHIPNLHFEVGNFHHLRFADGQFDFVFIIESLCHATNMPQALSEIQRVLKPGGRLVVIDGFRKAPLETFEPDLQTAALLVEKAMAVPKGFVIDEWIALAEDASFEVIEARDATPAIRPNLIRFHMLAKAFFKFPTTSKALMKIFGSPYLMGNAIAGLLLPYTVDCGLHGYYFVTLERR